MLRYILVAELAKILYKNVVGYRDDSTKSNIVQHRQDIQGLYK